MKHKKAVFRRGASALALVCASAIWMSQPAWAQEKPEPVELSATQIETNNRAVKLLGETPPRTREAIKLVEAALLMEARGDLLFLTLGRAYQLDGQCAKAAEQFDAAETAPGVQGVPPDFVPGQLAVYRAELKTCMGALFIACEPDDLELTMDRQPLACDSEIALEPGAYIIEGVNPSSGIEVEIPVQIVGGETTRSQLKIPGEKQVVDGPGAVVEPDTPASSSTFSWRATPYLGLAGGTNVLERTSGLERNAPSEARYLSYADQSMTFIVGGEGRALWGAPSLRYGVGGELRHERYLIDDLNGDNEAVFVDTGFKLALYPQLWFSERFGVFLGAAWRPRFLGVDFYLPNEDIDEVGSWSAGTALALGGGLKVELGDVIGLQGLELSVAWLQPTAGEARRLYRPGFVYSDDESANAVPALEAGVRAQFGRVTTSLAWEGWYAGATKDEECGPMMPCSYNLRATQIVFGLGWTFGD